MLGRWRELMVMGVEMRELRRRKKLAGEGRAVPHPPP
jgi:hypothetical protein